MSRVMVFGTFDIFHPGHRYFLENAGQGHDDVIVIIARSKHVEAVKGALPSQEEEDRRSRIQQEFPAYRVFLGDREHFLNPVHEHRPDLIILGYDQRLPPGVTTEDLPCPIKRIDAFHPERYKSSLMRDRKM